MKILIFISLMTVATVANAVVYNATTDGTTAPAGATFTTDNNNLLVAGNFNGFDEIGVTWREIDINHWLEISFTQPQVVDEIRLATLYKQGPFGDPNEMAKITFNGSTAYTLQAIDDAVAIWDGLGTVNNLSSAGLESAGGVWSIENPYGNTPVTSIKLEALHVAGGTASDSDFGLNYFKTSPVPDAGSTLALLGSAFTLLGAFSRKFRS